MFNKFKSIMLLCLAIVIVTACLSGCGNNLPEGIELASKEELKPEKIGDYGSLKLPLDDEYRKITMLVVSSETGINDSAVLKELRRRTGVNLELVPVAAASLSQKIPTLLASKTSMPDIFGSTFSVSEMSDFGIQGAFVALDEHLNEMPNMKKIFYDEPEKYGVSNAIKNMTGRDGHLYVFPSYDISRYVNSGTMYRKDIFDKHGLSADWSNPEEFYLTLKKLKELYPDSTPFAVKLKTQLFTRLGESWGLGTKGTESDFPPFYDEADGKWKLYSTDPRFKEILDFVKKLYDEGLLDREFLTTTDADWTSKMTQADKCFVTNDWIGRMSMFKEQTKDTVPGYNLCYAPPIGPTGKIMKLKTYGVGGSITNNDNKILSMKLCDYLISESGAQLLTMGIEGETYELDENGYAKYICLPEGETASITSLEKYGMFISGMYKRFDKRSVYYNFTEQEQIAQEYPETSGKGYEPIDPELSFTKEEIDEMSDARLALSKATEEFVVRYILNETDGNKAWKEWLKEAEKLGEDTVIKVYNQAQKRYDEI